MALQLEAPFTLIISGPSSSGKSTLAIYLINNVDYMVDKKIEKIIWCYAEESAADSVKKSLNKNLDVQFIKGLPESFENNEQTNILYVIDDLMMESYNKQICSLFTRGSHHNNLSVILIIQNLFHGGKYCRDISLNAKYLLVMKSPRDSYQFRYLAQQIFPEGADSLYRIYKAVTDEKPHSYLFIDFSQKSHSLLRFRTDIFNRNYSTVYCAPETDGNIKHETFKNELCYALSIENGVPKIT